MLARDIPRSYDETNRFLSAVFLRLVPALLDCSLNRIAIRQHPKKARYQPECTFALVLAGTSPLGPLYTSPRAPSCIWSRAPEEHVKNSQSNPRQTNSNLRWCRLPWGLSCSAALELAHRSQEALGCIGCQSPE